MIGIAHFANYWNLEELKPWDINKVVDVEPYVNNLTIFYTGMIGNKFNALLSAMLRGAFMSVTSNFMQTNFRKQLIGENGNYISKYYFSALQFDLEEN